MKSVDRRRRSRPRLECLEARSLLSTLAGPGSLDPSFGGGTGSTTLPLGLPVNSPTASDQAGVESVVVAPGGKVVVTGSITDSASSQSLSVARFNADGTIDTTFGVGGQAQLPMNGTFVAAAQSDGSIIEATTTTINTTIPTYEVVRLTPSGALDTTFGTNGIAEYPASTTTPTADRLASIDSVLVQSNGQIVLAGNSANEFAAVRLNSDGTLDTSYGTAGTAAAPVTASGALGKIVGSTASAAAIQANGQVVVAGTIVTGSFFLGYTQAAAVRLNVDGTVDTTFGTSGSVALPVDPANPSSGGHASGVAVAVDPTDQKVVVSANSYDVTSAGNYVFRLNADGSPDTTFGTAGVAMPISSGYVPDLIANTSIAGGSTAGSLAVDPTGRVIELSYSGSGAGTSVFRLNADGSTDKTFGNTTTLGPYQPGLKSLGYTLAMTIRPTTGAVILAGTGTAPTPNGRVYGYTVAQLLPATGPVASPLPPTPPASFERSGLANLDTTNLSVYLPALGDFAYRPTANFYTQTNHSPDVFNQFGIPGAGQTIPAAADYLGNGQTQVAAYLTSTGTYVIQPISGVTTGLAMQFGIPGAGNTIPTPADFEGTGAADVAVYLPSLGDYAIIPSNGQPARLVQFGSSGLGQSIPAPADYYGTHQADIAVYLTGSGSFAVQDPTGKTPGEVVQFGKPGLGQSIPVPGDYDGSGRTEFAVYIPAAGAFFYRSAISGKDVMVPIGAANSGEIPAPGDYDGSGHTEVAIFDPAKGSFEYLPANGGPAVTTYFGSAGAGNSIPVATPPGDLPQFPGSGSGGNGNAARPAFATAGPSASASSSVNTVSKASAVPAGPAQAPARVPRSLVNQGVNPDPWEVG